MFPVIKIGFLQIPSFGFMIFLGALAYTLFALVILVKINKKSRATVRQTLFVSLLSFVAMFLSALAIDALFQSIESGRIEFGGIAWEGGVIGGFIAFILLAHFAVKRERGGEIELFSSLIPGVVLAHAFGRVGCFLGGCCFGRITESPLGVVFPSGSAAAKLYPNTLTGVGSFPVLPTQLFEAGFELLLFALMIVFYKKLKRDNLSIYLCAYGIFRFILEYWRGDDRGGTGTFLSPSQLMSVLLVVAGVLIFLFRRGIIFKSLAKKCAEWRECAACGAYDSPAYELPSEKAEVFAQIDALHRLEKSGAITEDEYESKKAELLGKIK